MAKLITKCSSCGNLYKLSKHSKVCVNLGCVAYNKIVRRNNASRKKRQKKEILIQEEE
tara:strand:+ start:49 stop:222 length:174 start_codon:yes stop_codon:yes gene_type:complete